MSAQFEHARLLAGVSGLLRFADDPLGRLEEVRRRHGTRVFYEQVGIPFVIVMDPEGIEELLVEHAGSLNKDRFTSELGRVLGRGLVTSEGDLWRRQRKLMAPSFQPKHIGKLANVMVECTEALLAGYAAGQTRDVHADMMRLTLDIVVSTLFGSTPVSSDEVDEHLSAIMSDFHTLMFTFFAGGLRLRLRADDHAATACADPNGRRPTWTGTACTHALWVSSSRVVLTRAGLRRTNRLAATFLPVRLIRGALRRHVVSGGCARGRPTGRGRNMRFSSVWTVLAVFGCAGAPPVASQAPESNESEITSTPPKSAAIEATPDTQTEAVVAPATTRDLPTQCAGDDPCVPPAHFAESLCKGSYPSLALAMFEKSTPWQRKWVNVRSLEAVNAFGGSHTGGPLTFGEEVVLLRRQQAGGGGMQVSGGEDVEVLRWNGTCVTVRESELVEYAPGLPKHAPMVWAYFDEPTQAALLTKKTIASAREQQRKECRGSSKRDVSPSCEKAASGLDAAIVVAVRKGMVLPVPEKRPEWKTSEGGPALTADNRP